MLLAGQKMKIKKWFDSSREKILSLLFPPRCPICDEILTPEESEKGIHLTCERKLYPVKGAVCMHCGRPLGQDKSPYKRKNTYQENQMADTEAVLPEYMKLESTYEYCRECQKRWSMNDIGLYRHAMFLSRNANKSNPRFHGVSAITQAKALYLYKGAVKKAMYRFKYANKREYAVFFAKRAVEEYGDWLSQTEIIVPVPMYGKKQRQRGYNQAESFARELSRLTGIPVDKECVIRIKDTTPQKELSDVERKNNLENAFQKGKSIVQYRHILVVDDIYTTGYTAQAVARELRKQGGRHIYLLSICIGGNN